jgi:hypothetical protein
MAILVLLAVGGHPGGLLAALAGAAVPFVLWGGWRIVNAAHARISSAPLPLLAAMSSALVVIFRQRELVAGVPAADEGTSAGRGKIMQPEVVQGAILEMREQLGAIDELSTEVPRLAEQVRRLDMATDELGRILEHRILSYQDVILAEKIVSRAGKSVQEIRAEIDSPLPKGETVRKHQADISLRKYIHALAEVRTYLLQFRGILIMGSVVLNMGSSAISEHPVTQDDSKGQDKRDGESP